MIYQDQTYAPISPAVAERLEKATQYLTKTDFSALEDGAYEIDGKTIYVLLQSFHVEEGIDAAFETHRAYIDVQYVIDGRLDLCVTPANQLQADGSYDEENDVIFYKRDAAETILRLTPGNMAILFPQDAHRMVCAPSPKEPTYIRKCVVKVRI